MDHPTLEELVEILLHIYGVKLRQVYTDDDFGRLFIITLEELGGIMSGMYESEVKKWVEQLGVEGFAEAVRLRVIFEGIPYSVLGNT